MMRIWPPEDRGKTYQAPLSEDAGTGAVNMLRQLREQAAPVDAITEGE